MLAIGLQGNDKRKIALLLTVVGRSALDVCNTFVFTDNQKDKYNVVMAKFEEHCTQRKKRKRVRANRKVRHRPTAKKSVMQLRHIM